MTAAFSLIKGDRSPNYRGKLRDSNDNAVDITGATLTFKMVNEGSWTTLVVNETATIVTATDGEFEYAWTTGDASSLTTGHKRVQVKVAYSGGRVEHFPNNIRYGDVVEVGPMLGT